MKNKVLAATYNPVTNSKVFTIMIDLPYCLLPELLEYKELDVTYIKFKNLNPDNLSEPSLQKLKDYLNKKGISQENVDTLFKPFAYTTCTISGGNWNNFFEKLCPKYVVPFDANPEWDRVYKSKKEGRLDIINYYSDLNVFDKQDSQDIITHMDSNNIWNTINKSTISLELQNIAETIYDLYQEIEWKKSEYHIPFEEDIDMWFYNELLNLLHIKYDIDTIEEDNYYNQYNKWSPKFKIFSDKLYKDLREYYYIKISDSLCSVFNYEIDPNIPLEQYFK